MTGSEGSGGLGSRICTGARSVGVGLGVGRGLLERRYEWDDNDKTGVIIIALTLVSEEGFPSVVPGLLRGQHPRRHQTSRHRPRDSRPSRPLSTALDQHQLTIAPRCTQARPYWHPGPSRG